MTILSLLETLTILRLTGKILLTFQIMKANLLNQLTLVFDSQSSVVEYQVYALVHRLDDLVDVRHRIS